MAVREASGATAASIQAAVDQFRADLGQPNNGVVAGSQAAGRREINWDGGGPAIPATFDPSPMTTFAARGATFVAPGNGFETSGAAPPTEFTDVNPAYGALFAPFSAPRLFVPLNTNVTDVLFNVPGNTAVPAGVTGFGAVFTDVDSATGTHLQFFAPDGALLFERAVPAARSDETLSFLGVSFDKGEIVARVRIVSGNAALGPDEAAPSTWSRWTTSSAPSRCPSTALSSRLRPEGFQTASFDLVTDVDSTTHPISGRLTFDGTDATESLGACFTPGTLRRGGTTFSCHVPEGLLTEGEHVLQVVVTDADRTLRRNAVRWLVIGAPRQ